MGMKELYTENYKKLMKGIEEDTNIANLSCVHILVLLKFPYIKVTYRFNVIPIKILKAFFTKIGKKTLKFIWNDKRPQRAIQERAQNWKPCTDFRL